jgi:oligoendopeptidase F
MTDENKISMEEIIDQAKEGLDEPKNDTKEEDAQHQNSGEEIQKENSEQVEETSNEDTSATPILRAISTAEKIDRALPQVTGLDAEDQDMDTYANEAMKSYQDLMNLGMNVEVRHSGKLFEVASTMLKNAVEAKNAKLEKKLRMVELQLKKQRIDQMSKTGDSSADIVEGEGYVVGDRNELLKQILDRVDNDKKDK